MHLCTHSHCYCYSKPFTINLFQCWSESDSGHWESGMETFRTPFSHVTPGENSRAWHPHFTAAGPSSWGPRLANKTCRVAHSACSFQVAHCAFHRYLLGGSEASSILSIFVFHLKSHFNWTSRTPSAYLPGGTQSLRERWSDS